METGAVEESFSWTPRSRKTFVREVPLLSRGRRSGLSRSGKTEKTEREEGLPSHKQPKSIQGGETSPPDLGARLWVHTEGPPPPPPPEGGLGGWGSVGRGLRGGE